MDLLRSNLEGFLSDFETPGRWYAQELMPKTNLYDKGGKLEFIAEVPGFSREDLQVKIQGNYLELSGKRKADAPEGYTSHRHEREAITFSRSYTLPCDVNGEGVEATLRDGVLRLILPKSEAATPRQITIG
jgi:HSP20 family protein